MSEVGKALSTLGLPACDYAGHSFRIGAATAAAAAGMEDSPPTWSLEQRGIPKLHPDASAATRFGVSLNFSHRIVARTQVATVSVIDYSAHTAQAVHKTLTWFAHTTYYHYFLRLGVCVVSLVNVDPWGIGSAYAYATPGGVTHAGPSTYTPSDGACPTDPSHYPQK